MEYDEWKFTAPTGQEIECAIATCLERRTLKKTIFELKFPGACLLRHLVSTVFFQC